MNSLKSLFVVAVMAAIAYGAYVSITRPPQGAQVADNAPKWTGGPSNLQMSGAPAGPPNLQVSIPGGAGPTAIAAGTSPTGGSVGMPAGIAAMPAFPNAPPGATGSPLARGAGPGSTAGQSQPPWPGLSPPTATPGAPSPVTSGTSLPPSGFAAPATSSAPGGIGAPTGTVLDGPAASIGTPAGPASIAPGAGAADQGVRDEVRAKFLSFIQAAHAKLDQGQLGEAHMQLSTLYGNPELPPDLAQQLTALLDQVAGTVIYSRQHLLEPPHIVRPGESLQQIAEAYKVPWQLLARINGIQDPASVAPGTELKVVRGPFNALVDVSKYELTLMLGGRYAGRFAVGLGRDQPQQEGAYTVTAKAEGPQYYGPGNVQVGPNDPNNPLGKYWIGLNGANNTTLGIHGTNNPATIRRNDGQGGICLGDRDIEDVFSILSVGSRVVIQR